MRLRRAVVRAAISAALAVGPGLARAQQPPQPTLPQLPSLRVSAAPAFVLLGAAPVSVDRPSSPTDLGLDLADRTGFFQALPRDFALETSPYWLLGHPGLSWRDDTTRSLGPSLARTFSISAASAQLGDSALPLTGVSIGVRVLPLSGRLSRATAARYDTLERSLGRENALFFRSYAAERARLDSTTTAFLGTLRTVFRDNPAALETARAAVTAQYQAAKAQLEARIFADSAYRSGIGSERAARGPIVAAREGTILELAAASAWAFPNAVWARGRYQRAAAWAALSYEGPRVTPVLLLRYQAQGDTLPGLFDAGGRLILDGPVWGLSLEGVYRRPLRASQPNLYRVSGMLEYQVAPQLWVVGTFGKDYQSQRSGSLLAQLGVKLNINSERYAAP